MSLLDEEEETQRVLTCAAMIASDISYPEAWQRYAEYTGLVGAFEIRAYLAGLISLPIVECNLLAHAVNELIDEQRPRLKAPHRGCIPWAMNPTNTVERDKALDEILRQLRTAASHEGIRHWRES